MADILPEGTDTIIEGASAAGGPADGARSADAPAASGGSASGSKSAGSVGQNATSTGNERSADNERSDSRAASGDGDNVGFAERVQSLRGQATDRARDFASQGKDRVTNLLDEAARSIEEVAGQLDERVGGPAGEQVRRASSTVSGFADTLRSQDVDQLFAQAADLARRSPAVAVGAAAALGFVIARLIKSGSSSASTSVSSRPGNSASTKA